MTLKLRDFQEQFMMDSFSIQLTQFDKTGTIGENFFPLRDLKIKIHFRNKKLDPFFVIFTLLLFNIGVCLPFINRNNETRLLVSALGSIA